MTLPDWNSIHPWVKSAVIAFTAGLTMGALDALISLDLATATLMDFRKSLAIGVTTGLIALRAYLAQPPK